MTDLQFQKDLQTRQAAYAQHQKRLRAVAGSQPTPMTDVEFQAELDRLKEQHEAPRLARMRELRGGLKPGAPLGGGAPKVAGKAKQDPRLARMQAVAAEKRARQARGLCQVQAARPLVATLVEPDRSDDGRLARMKAARGELAAR